MGLSLLLNDREVSAEGEGQRRDLGDEEGEDGEFAACKLYK